MMMRPSHVRFAAFARSNTCIAIGMLIAAFSLFTIYLVVLDPPPLCDHLCAFLALGPIVTCTLWSIWLVAWHFPDWRQTARIRKSSVSTLAVLALGQFVWLWNQ